MGPTIITGSGSPTAAYSVPTAITLSGAPQVGSLLSLRVAFANRAGGATALTGYISSDAAGDVPLTGEVTFSTAGAVTVAAKGGGLGVLVQPVPYEFDAPYSGNLYFFSKWNAGTGDVSAYLSIQRPTS